MEVLFPRTVEELQTMMTDAPEGLIMAGGTDLLVKMRRTGSKPPAVFCVERIKDMQQISALENEIVIGAAVTLKRLVENETVQTELPALFQSLSMLASPSVRNCATLAGNLCTASPAGDTLPPLHVLDAMVELCSPAGSRCQSMAEFITGPGQTSLRRGEFVAAVRIPRPSAGRHSAYFKVGKRKAMAIAVASLATMLETGEDGNIKHIKLAWGSVGPTVVMAPDAEAYLTGRSLSLESLHEAGRIAGAEFHPIDDIRGSADYRRRVAGNLLLRLIEMK